MSVLLAVMTCEKCSPTLLRHWPWFLRQDADYNYVLTTDKPCECPSDAHILSVGTDSYISGATLPKRMIDSIARLLELPWNILILAEYDTLIINRIRTEAMELGVAAHLAGHLPEYDFYHNPWTMMREPAIRFMNEGRRVIEEGLCGYGSKESSPDCFFGLVCHRLKQKIDVHLWKEFSRNSFDIPGDLNSARDAYRNSYDVIHGLKTAEQLAFITG